jgi:hypothetical protein
MEKQDDTATLIATIKRLESQVDSLKEVVMQIAWELEMRHKHRYITKKEEDFLKSRSKTGV